MHDLGRRGGSVRPNTKLRLAADDGLREQARVVLSKALRGDDVDKAQLDAAKSLFAYRAAAPPAPEQSSAASAPKIIHLADILEAAFESHGILELHGTLECDGRTWPRP